MKYTKEQIHDAIIARHKEVFGYIGKDDEGEEVHRDGYFIAGFVKDALDNFEQRLESGHLETLVTPQMEWVSVDDRMPNNREQKIVWVEPTEYGIDSNAGVRLTTPTPAKTGFYVKHKSGHAAEEVTHWMPLPKPPKD